MLRRLKTSTLLAVAGGAGIALGGMALLLSRESTRYANQAVFVKTALDFVEKEQEILDMIGQPYSLGQPKIMDLWINTDTNNVKVRVPVKGPNDTAFIYAFARKKNTKDRLKLFKIEMTFNKIQGKKMILFDVEDKGTDHDVLAADPVENEKEKNKKDSPIPEGMIPQIDPNKPRRIPKSVLRHRAEKASQEGSVTDTKSDASATTTTTATDESHQSQSKADKKQTNS